MKEKLDAIDRELASFKLSFNIALDKHPSDERKKLLVKLVDQLCLCIGTHAELILVEANGRFTIDLKDYYQILDAYLPLFKEIKTLPRARKNSIYEIGLVSNLDRIIKSHCEGEEIE
jgi:hypothetical protein